jgi:hypothetical protein
MAVRSSKSPKVAAKKRASSKHLKRGGSSSSTTACDSNQQVLSWRKNPETSFSDWTLEIAHKTSSNSASGSASVVVVVDAVYHVHKCILAFGPHRSDYFAALFQQQMKENQTNTSRIELETESQAKLVPYLLDSIYPEYEDDDQEQEQLSLQESFQLLHLAEYFQALGLPERLAPCMCEGLTMTNAIDFIHQAKKLHNYRPLLEEAGKKLGHVFEEMTEVVAAELEPEIFLIALRSYFLCKEDPEDSSDGFDLFDHVTHILTMMAICFENHIEDLSSEIFNEILVHNKNLVTCYYATEIVPLCRLMTVECKFLPPGTAELTPLQERCIQAFKYKPRSRDAGNVFCMFENRENCVEALKKVPPLVLSHMLANTCSSFSW